ncbi:hypothetical protein CDAR_259001 [Caerostris darwini]|uniref:Reverse transcriptase domain-containing protein n=1 Tax=Caerostris darwini TaxID=1538125 RepID=A0AAV4PQK5_9ARAC|nr:hypothetical protein CDAR_259001 [Caerostris darwini]
MSPRRDKIHAEFLKHIGPNAKSTLLRFFNYIWKMGIVPVNWKRPMTVLILKKDKEATNTQSYMPISLTSIMVKLMESMIVNRLTGSLKLMIYFATNKLCFAEIDLLLIMWLI